MYSGYVKSEFTRQTCFAFLRFDEFDVIFLIFVYQLVHHERKCAKNFDTESIKQVPLTTEDLYHRQMAMLKSFLEHGAISLEHQRRGLNSKDAFAAEGVILRLFLCLHYSIVICGPISCVGSPCISSSRLSTP